MKFLDIIKSNSWLNIESVFLKLYPDEKNNISGYEKVFNELKHLTPVETDVTILVSREFDDFDKQEYAHVSGYYNNPQKSNNEITDSLAIEFTPWEKWLGMDVDTNSLQNFTTVEIICHCLFEMSFFGFEQDEIKEQLDAINDEADEIKNMDEEEKKEKLISFDDMMKWLKDNELN
jgi:hypothetical protein